MGSFRVNLKKIIDDSYDIEIGYELFDKLIEDLQNGLVGDIRKFAVITDDTVKDLYAQKLNSLLQDNGYAANIISFPAGEKSKTRATKEYVEDTMLELGYRRDCCIIAVGGGVVTDLAGFVAGTFGRGVPFINYVTTLLAAADASVDWQKLLSMHVLQIENSSIIFLIIWMRFWLWMKQYANI